MNITEDKLKAAIQIALGMRGIYTEEIESALIHHTKALSIQGVSISFKANIEAKIVELEQKLASISKDVEMSFTEPENWKKEMHLINGKIDGLKLALNEC